MKLRPRYSTLFAVATVVAVACTTDTLIGPKDVAILVIAPDTVSVPVHDTILLQAVATDSRGVKYIGERITWTSSDPSVASISPVGTLVTLTIGSTTITATAGGKSASALVTVTPAPTLTPSADSVGFATIARGPEPASQLIVVTNTGGGALTGVTPGSVTYVGPDTGWLSISQSGVTAPDTITLNITVDTFPVGTYTASFPITAPKTTNGPQTLKVTLTLGAGAPSQVILSAGDTQTATVKTGVALAPAVVVKDVAGNLIPGVSVTFAVAASNGTVTGGVATTNAMGVATVGSWTLDSVAKADTLTATVAALAPVTFTATGKAGAASQVIKSAGDGQSAAAGAAVSAAPAVTVKDQYGNVVAGVTVTFATTVTNGSVTGASVGTSAAGTAAVGSWTLGTVAKTDSLTAAAAGVATPATFTASATAGAATTIAKSAGGTTGAVNTDVAPAPAVIVTDQFGNPVQGVAVTFAATAANGAVTGGVPTTNAAGVASVGSWKLATNTRTDTLTATSGALTGSPITFAVTATAGAATSMVKDSGDGLTLAAGAAVIPAPAVLVKDAFSNPVSGVAVTFAIASGGGSVLPATPVPTNAAGVASAASWQLGTAPGANSLSASASGLATVTFSATATTGLADSIARAGAASHTDTINATLTLDSVRVADAHGNPVSGTTVTWSAGGPGAITGSSITGANGIATATRTLGGTLGTVTDTAKVVGLIGSPVLFTTTTTAGHGATLLKGAGDAQTDTVGATLPIAYTDTVRDRAGNPVSGVTVTWAAAGGGTITPTSITGANGAATATRVLGTTAGSQTATATVAGLTGSPLSFSATATPGTAKLIAAVAGTNNQAATVSTNVAPPPSVKVTDQFGNPVSSVTISFALGTGGGRNGSITGTAPSTSPAGVATLTTWTLGGTTGPDTVTATAAGLTGSPVTFIDFGNTGGATTIALAGGNSQTDTVRGTLAHLDSVLITDGVNPVSGVTVTWTVTKGGGTITPTSASNANGIAVAQWVLGDTAGTQTVLAAVVGFTGSPVTFAATATHGAPASLAKNGGDAQSAAAGTAVAIAPSVLVKDQFNNPVSGLTVTFAPVGATNGAVTGGTPVTTAGGIATVGTWTLGNSAKTDSLTATGGGLPTVTFTATTTATGATTIARLGSAAQSDTIGATLAIPDSVKVTDQFGNPVSGVAVTWVAGGAGTLTPGGASTNAAGIATATRVLGTTVGAATDTAKAGLTGSPILFTATTTAGQGATLVRGAGDAQTDTVGATLAAAYTDTVKDRAGNPVAGVTLTWGVTGGGSITPTSITSANGVATATRILGTVAGAQGATGTVAGLAGSPVTFTATANHGAAKLLTAVAGTNNQSATVSTLVATPPSVKVTDQFTNPISGVAVSYALGAGGATNGSITGTTPTTNGSGVAPLTSWTLGAVAKPDTVIATSAGLTGSPLIFVDFGNSGLATTMSLAGGNSQTDTVLATLPRLDSVLVTDGTNPISGVTVSWAVTTGGGTIVPTSLTNASGIAVAQWVLGGTAGTQNSTASVGGLLGSPVTFTATATHGAAKTIAVNAGDGQSATVGATLPTAPSVIVKDNYGNVVSGVTITFAATVRNGSITGATPATTGGGVATVGSWTIGTMVGPDTLTATAAGLTGSPVIITATGTTGSATTIARLGSAAQGDTIGTTLPILDSVKVTDQFSNPVASVAVNWFSGDAGTLTPTTGTTNALGIATATRTLGTVAGTVSDSAKAAGLTGSPVLFTTATTAGHGATLVKGAGDAQSDTVGATLATAYTDTVKDRGGNPVSGVTVSWAAVGGSITPTSITGASGVATATRVLGTAVGTQTATGTVAGLAGSPVSFSATATHGAAKLISIVAGTNGQGATAGTAVTLPPAAKVTDQFSNPVSGVTVSFALGAGGARNGSLTGATPTTDGTGVATLGSWTLGGTAGPDTVTATAAGLTGSPLIYVDNGTAGSPTTMSSAGGNGQTDTVRATLPHLDSVLVTDGLNPVNGVTVAWAVTKGAGTIPPTSITNANGIAVAQWVLGDTAETQTATATVGGLIGSPVTFSATATHGAAKTIAVNGGNGQTATVNTAVATAPSAKVTDQFGNPVSGVGITFAIGSGGGGVTGATPTTDGTGVVSVGSWTLGIAAGANTLTATAGGLTGSPLSFSATGTAGAPFAMTASAGTGQSATVSSAVPIAPAVLVVDQFSNPVSGVAVTFAPATVASGNVSGGSLNTDLTGTAAVISWTLGTAAKTDTLIATSGGLPPVTFFATATPGAATTLAKTGGDAQTDSAKTKLSALTVLVTDVGGNPISGATVNWLVTSGSATLALASSITNGSGIAADTVTFGTTAGGVTVQASSGALTPVTFSETATAGNPTTLAKNGGDGQNATVNTVVATAPSVKVTDQFNNPVNGVLITFAIGSGGGSRTGPTPTTAANGIATVGSWTLGTTAGANTLTATATGFAGGGNPATFSATGTAGAVSASLSTVTAGTASITACSSGCVVGTTASTITVTAVDQFNNPINGAPVTISATGSGNAFTPSSGNTNSSGVLAFTFNSTQALAKTVTAVVSGVTITQAPSVTVTPDAVSATTSTVAVSSASMTACSTSCVVGSTAVTVTVTVKDQFSNVRPSSSVSLSATGTVNTFTPSSGTTDVNGQFASTFNATLVGTHTVTAVANVSTTITQTQNVTVNAAAAASIAVNAGNNQTVRVGTAVPTLPSVIVKDAFGNVKSGVTVTFAVATGGGSATGTSTTTAGTGIATVGSWTVQAAVAASGTGTHSNTLTGTATGFAGGGNPVTFTAQGIYTLSGDAQPIFTASCVSCHGVSGSAPNLTAGTTHSTTVGIASTCTSGTRIVAGSASTSVLFLRIQGGSCGVMPPSGGQISAANQNIIKDWINNGAQAN